MPTSLATASLGSCHYRQSFVTIWDTRTIIGPKFFGYTSCRICLCICATSCNYTTWFCSGAILAQFFMDHVSSSTIKAHQSHHLLLHHSIYLHSIMENELHFLDAQHGYQINCNKGQYIPGKPYNHTQKWTLLHHSKLPRSNIEGNVLISVLCQGSVM